MSADTAPALFADRPIRPLPKRRLRERLSPEVAESIQYPPAPRIVPPLFQYPYTLRDDEADPASTNRDRSAENSSRAGKGGTGADDEANRESRAGGLGPGGRGGRRLPATGQPGAGNSQSVPSAASSLDGYDLLENTNNKKKRKIPSAGDAALHSMHMMNDAAMGSNASKAGSSLSSDSRGEQLAPTSTPYYGSGSFASASQNLAGPGRGRFGRHRSSRSPLRPLSDSMNNKTGKLRSGQWGSGTVENTGIISSAIANAGKLPQHGQENMSLLNSQLPTKRGPALTQFTFTCDSQVPGSLAWPGSDRRMTAPSTQPATGRPANEDWKRGNAAAQPRGALASPAGSQSTESVPKEGVLRGGGRPPTQDAAAPKPPRKKPSQQQYKLAADARQRRTLENNKCRPPKEADIWICEFCEYETIFGQPPMALIRQYEINDMKKRRLEQERKAKLESMKKGKNRKQRHGKGSAKTSSAAQHDHGSADRHGGTDSGTFSQGTRSETDDFEDSFGPDDAMSPEQLDLGGRLALDDGTPGPPPPGRGALRHTEDGT